MDAIRSTTEILLIRHAKTKAQAVGQRDFDRSLRQPRAGNDIKDVSMSFQKRYENIPAHVLCSPARRARQTLEGLVRSGLVNEDHLHFPEQLYLASADEIQEVLEYYFFQFKPDRMIIVGHNPGLAGVAHRIPALQFDHLPTTGLVHFSHPKQATSLDWSKVELKSFLYPKLVRT
jgi:phosphohistidine phosphatase